MKRILIGTIGLLVLLAAGAVSVSAASAPREKLRGFSCQRSLKPVGRGIAVTAVMRPVKGTQKMALRFELITRTKAAPAWAPVTGGDLGNWVYPTDPPTLGQRPADVWIYNKSVNELAAPAGYRLRVWFRWFGTHNRVLATSDRLTPTCVQPELRPDLQVQAIDVQPITGKPKYDRYVATIANGGATPARQFRVQFAPGGGLSAVYKSIRVLSPHSSTTASFVGPACNSTAASTVTADPDGVVDDYDRSNNTMTAVCSSTAGQQ